MRPTQRSLRRKRPTRPLVHVYDFDSDESDASHSNSTEGSPYSSGSKHCRLRKSSHQLEVLQHEFHSHHTWSKQKVEELAETLGLSCNQVYKWRWDFKKRLAHSQDDHALQPLLARETLTPGQLEWDLDYLRADYKRLFENPDACSSPSGFLACSNFS